jgi:transposase
MKLQVLGIDLGKTVFHLVGLDSTGRVVIRKRCSRTQLLAFTANLQVQLIGMEACSGAHFLGRALREQGHEVRLMPAQYVKPYVQTNKSDYLDAEAIAEAVQRPRMRFVPIKTEEQLDLQALHRVRERWVMRRTAGVASPQNAPTPPLAGDRFAYRAALLMVVTDDPCQLPAIGLFLPYVHELR